MMKHALILAAPLFLLSACQMQEAKESEDPVASTDAAKDATADYNEAQKAYAAANDKMHSAMGGTINADADIAFMQGMIPHHQGAVEMAQVVLKHGKDPEVRALAQKVIAAQEAEIKEMQAWLDKRGAKAAAPAEGEVDHKAMGH